MRLNGTLEQYLKEVNQEATDMLKTLVRQYAKAEGVTEALKRSDQLEWVRRMNNIRNRAEEVVLNEIIYRLTHEAGRSIPRLDSMNHYTKYFLRIRPLYKTHRLLVNSRFSEFQACLCVSIPRSQNPQADLHNKIPID